MSLLYDEGQQAIGVEAERVILAHHDMSGQLARLEQRDQYDADFWAMCREQGWTGIALPEAHGGLGLSLIELGIVAQACGGVTSGAPFLTSSFGAARGLLDHGDDSVKAAWLPALAAGDAIGAIGFAEGTAMLPAASGLSFANGALTGTKTAVSAGSVADVALLLATENGAPVLVAAPLAGVERRGFNSFDNSRCTADLVFDQAPATALLRGQAALDAALHILALQAVVTAHEQTGGALAMMTRARDYAVTRRAFGQVIGAFQSVKHRIAELYALVELARANAIHAASREGQRDFILAAAAARLSATEAYDTAARDCVQIHGGIGVTWEAGLHLHMRRTRSLAIEQGNGLFWEDILVNQLSGDAA